MSTANDLILGALRNANIYNPADPLAPGDQSTVLDALNDLLDSLSTDHLFIPYSVENVIQWTPGKFQYSIGNPVISGASTFSGTFTQGSNFITGITSVPSTLKVGAWLTETGGALPSSAAGTPVTVTAIGASAVSFSGPLGSLVNASRTVTENITYTTPADIAYDNNTGAVIQRPLKIQPGFTRITTAAASGLDYWYDVVSLTRYKEYGWKAVPGPWPYVLSYNPTFPYGTFWVYPAPQQAGEVHFWSDVILTTFTSTNDNFSLPQGYSRALKKLLAMEICPIYGKNPHPLLVRQAKEAMDMLKAQNAEPVVELRYDSELVRSQSHDAGWIIHGGFI